MSATGQKRDRSQYTAHVRARGPHPAYPERAPVVDDAVPWETEVADYQPVEFVHKAVVANDSSVKPDGWADPQVRRAARSRLPTRSAN